MKFLLISCIAAIVITCEVAHGEDGPDGLANYAYSVFAGTGQYTIDDRTIYVFRAPLLFDLREADPESGNNFGMTLLLPITVGLTDFENVDEIPELDIDDLQTLSIVPGLEFSFMLESGWELKPFAQAGLGVDAKSDAESFIWGTGIRTTTTVGDNANWLVGGEFLWAGNNPNQGQSRTSFTRWGIGTEYRIPTQQQWLGRRISWHGRLIRWYYSDPVNFEPPLRPSKLRDSTEIGISIGFNRAFNILGYELTQAGIGWETGDDYEAITLFTSFPF